MLIEKFSWSLRDIDETDIVNLLGFIKHYPSYKNRSARSMKNQTYCDEVDWL